MRNRDPKEPRPTLEQRLAKMSAKDRDWLEVFGNQYKAQKVMPGTCERCVWGRGDHVDDCDWHNRWFCSWCYADSHAPAVDELIICPECGTAGVVQGREVVAEMRRRKSLAAMTNG